MSRAKKKATQEPIPPVDAAEFTNVVRKMVSTPPITRENVSKKLRKNPETDPRYLPVFDFSRTIRIEHQPKPQKKKRN